ncbi:Ada metal-binding domain-containing protein [uncultured Desulfosarcina sp.]|uniref:Ada metal-binding domain-containing protein n=1 Tax=uncultured Desulfosarcina sp. TaxID=218289 RepID=UPI0029C99A31|nr:Ada metal-binding domain-containing protein [uncultured Desulfosarcina sp.]
MQIKRFEAADMTEALRLVKHEFGDNAVILSAKEIRAGGFFSALRKKSVEITAATDYPVDDARDNHEFSGLLSEHLNSEGETDRVSLSSSPQTIMPLSLKDRPFLHQPPAPKKKHSPLDGWDSIPKQGFIPDAVKSDLETKGNPMADEGSRLKRMLHSDNNRLIAEPFYRDLAAQKVIALAGPCGVGKTTTVAKLAWHCRVVEKKRIGLISLDRFRIGANGMLARVAQIMNLPLIIIHDAEQLQSALTDLMDVDVVLIDTPGMNSTDPSMMDDICALLRSAKPDEIHLVVSATVRDDVFEATVNSFSPLGVNRLLLTHMDEHINGGVVLDLLKKSGLPSSFFGDGVDLFDGLQESTADRLGGFPPNRKPVGGRVTVFSGKREQIKTGSVGSDDNSDSVHYVANCNSELFHHPTCKSVKRINAENITAFNSIEQAMDEGFKPCRACCDISMIRKSVNGSFGFQRASAL